MKSKIHWPTKTNGVPDKVPSVEFKNVDFSYPDAEEKVISGVSFVAKAGETTAFIGSTGSGKSTLINLVPRFYETTGGDILVDGISIRDYEKDDLLNICQISLMRISNRAGRMCRVAKNNGFRLRGQFARNQKFSFLTIRFRLLI